MNKSNNIRATFLECRPLFWSALWFSMFINILMLAVPLYSLQVLDRVLSSGSTDTLLMLSIIAAISLVFMGLLQGLRALIFSHVGRWLDDKLSFDLARKTVDAAVYKPSIGTQPLRDLETLKRFVTSPAFASVFDAPWAPIYFIVIFLIQIKLGITVVLGAIVLLILALIAERVPSKKLAAANEHQIDSMQALDSLVRNAEVVRSMGLLKHAAKGWSDANQKALEYSFSASNLGTIISYLTRTLRMGLQILLTGLGAWFVLNGQMSAGGIIAVSILSGKALAPFDAAVSIYQSWIGVKKAYMRLTNLDESAPEIKSQLELPEPQGHIMLEKTTYQNKGSQRWILQGIHVEIEAGEAVGIIGPSGSGKTTLARLITGVLYPTSGHVRIDGASLNQWDSEQLGSIIGYLPQSVELFSGTISQNIARMNEQAEDADVIAAAKMASVHEAILQFPDGYQTDIGTNGSNLSAGQRQRIGLARCFFGNPKVIVLDEPNANLDTEGEQALVECLSKAKNERITTITIAHRPSVLQKVDKILVLHGGETKFFGPAKEVMAKLTPGNAKVQPLRPAPETIQKVIHGE